MGRLPSRIDSGSTFTAEQWMNWTLYFSIYCLYGLLDNDQIESWQAFVLACRRLCKRSITEEDIKYSVLQASKKGLWIKICYNQHAYAFTFS